MLREAWHRAFVLHRRPYSETSLLLDLFTEKEGRITVLAKGARGRNSNLKGCLQPFVPLLARWSGRGEIKILCYAEPISLALPLSGNLLYSGFYVNELLSRLLEPGTNYSELFFAYLHCLKNLSLQSLTKGSPEHALRQFELATLANLGYGVDFLHCALSGQKVKAGMIYHYQQKKGFIVSSVISNDSFTGRELQALACGEFPDAETLRAAKRFTRMALRPYLGNKPLKSRELFL